jgi:predicted nucleic acid-binding protein
MSGHKYLADTNVFIFLLDKHPALKSFLETEWFYSFITEIELKGKRSIAANELRNITDMLSVCIKVSHVEEINDITISLKQQFKIKTPDAIIAATSLYKNIPLITFDKGFATIRSLDLVLLEP